MMIKDIDHKVKQAQLLKTKYISKDSLPSFEIVRQELGFTLIEYKFAVIYLGWD